MNVRTHEHTHQEASSKLQVFTPATAGFSLSNHWQKTNRKPTTKNVKLNG
ncbi:hypothetical protein NC99_00740 [Sunxiuqinia dokdonensis]|uniref:Uncharacterized protein n=1 Tax=Sunxiuqinia dokdonensis TaxID=1409788 RepID=A0A0L8VFF7_9BACT|nr:hypothetical protein NC99_00740 [Sunxiuqinia dokdonensis]